MSTSVPPTKRNRGKILDIIRYSLIIIIGAGLFIYKWWPDNKKEGAKKGVQSQSITVSDSSKIEGGVQQIQASDSAKINYNDNRTTAPVDRSTHTIINPTPPPPKPRHLSAEDKKIIDTMSADDVRVEIQGYYDHDTKEPETYDYGEQIIKYVIAHHRIQIIEGTAAQITGPPANANDRFYIQQNTIKIYRQKY
jgi:hypothetical protein